MPSRPHVRKRRARAMEMREKILDAARSLFAIEGFDAVTMRAVGLKADYTPSAIYKHFANKEAILVELRHDVLSRLALAVMDGVQEVLMRFGEPMGALREASIRYLAFASRDRPGYALAFSTAPSGTDPMDPKPVVDAMSELIARSEGATDEIAQRHRDRATVLWHALHGRALSSWQGGQDDATFVDLCLASMVLEAQSR